MMEYFRKNKVLGTIVTGVVAGSVIAYIYNRYQRNKEDSVTVSAPGKALVAGGYLVLEHPNVGVVVSCSSRFYASIKALPFNTLLNDSNVDIGNNSGTSIVVRVHSPQFHSEQLYSYDWEQGTIVQLSKAGNEFVEKCLYIVFAYLLKHQSVCEDTTATRASYTSFTDALCRLRDQKCALGIKLRAHNDFYSQIAALQAAGQPLLSSTLQKLPDFLPCPIDMNTGEVIVAKTGMGSSAALTTSLVGALLKYFNCIALYALDKESNGHTKDRRIVHNLSQLAHAVAQGKIGSGFDVSAAVYGSQLYRRFSPSGFNDCMDACADVSNSANSQNSGTTIYAAVMNQVLWKGCEANAFALPTGLNIMMGDVAGGSSSTSMAKAVLAWKKSGDITVQKHWTELGNVNADIHKQFIVLKAYEGNYSEEYNNVISCISDLPSSQWSIQINNTNEIMNIILKIILDIKILFGTTRRLLKSMGEQAGVGIEPNDQTTLCNATEEIPGVLCAGVPGAGGIDAIFAVTLSSSARNRVENMWSLWHTTSAGKVETVTKVCPLVLSAETNPLQAGVRCEDLSYD